MKSKRLDIVQPGPVSAGELRHYFALVSDLMDGNYDDAAKCLRSAGSSPVAFLAFAESNYLGGFLSSVLDDSDLRGVFPEHELEVLLTAARRREKFQSSIVAEISRLWDRLEVRGIEAILLKGPYLADRFCFRRTFVDLDLLVKRFQLADLETLLIEMNYRRLSQFLISRGVSTRFAHGFDFARGRLRIDAHWCFGSHISYRVDYERVWRDSWRFRLSSGADVRVLSDDDSLFLLLLSIFEDIDRGGFRLRSFVDLHAMLGSLDSAIAWPAFWEQRRTERTRRPCQAVLALFFVLFSAENNFPHAAASVTEIIRQTRELPWSDTAALVLASPGRLRNKLWGLKYYECSALASLLWWGVSLPFRLMIYQRKRK